MSQGTNNELVAARLHRVPWWRAAFGRFVIEKRRRRHQATLDHLAERDVTDTIGEADVNSWLETLEGETRRQSGKHRDP